MRVIRLRLHVVRILCRMAEKIIKPCKLAHSVGLKKISILAQCLQMHLHFHQTILQLKNGATTMTQISAILMAASIHGRKQMHW